jgi:hypothetical protein
MEIGLAAGRGIRKAEPRIGGTKKSERERPNKQNRIRMEMGLAAGRGIRKAEPRIGGTKKSERERQNKQNTKLWRNTVP